MVQRFEEYICGFTKEQSVILKKYLLAALDDKDQKISYLDESLGTPVRSDDIRNCELLTDVKLFREEIQLTRDGRNRWHSR
jgi:hypothetical protein